MSLSLGILLSSFTFVSVAETFSSKYGKLSAFSEDFERCPIVEPETAAEFISDYENLSFKNRVEKIQYGLALTNGCTYRSTQAYYNGLHLRKIGSDTTIMAGTLGMLAGGLAGGYWGYTDGSDEAMLGGAWGGLLLGPLIGVGAIYLANSPIRNEINRTAKLCSSKDWECEHSNRVDYRDLESHLEKFFENYSAVQSYLVSPITVSAEADPDPRPRKTIDKHDKINGKKTLVRREVRRGFTPSKKIDGLRPLSEVIEKSPKDRQAYSQRLNDELEGTQSYYRNFRPVLSNYEHFFYSGIVTGVSDGGRIEALRAISANQSLEESDNGAHYMVERYSNSLSADFIKSLQPEKYADLMELEIALRNRSAILRDELSVNEKWQRFDGKYSSMLETCKQGYSGLKYKSDYSSRLSSVDREYSSYVSDASELNTKAPRKVSRACDSYLRNLKSKEKRAKSKPVPKTRSRSSSSKPTGNCRYTQYGYFCCNSRSKLSSVPKRAVLYGMRGFSTRRALAASVRDHGCWWR